MKRWAALTVGMYLIALVLVTTPAFLIGFAGWAPKPEGIGTLLEAHSSYITWIWLAVLATGQALLLLVPIHIAERRLPPRRPVYILAIVTAFFLANLLPGGAMSIAVIFWILWAVVFRRIATGIFVMLLCFGPGVYFLFVERFRRLQSRGKSK